MIENKGFYLRINKKTEVLTFKKIEEMLIISKKLMLLRNIWRIK